MIQISPKWSFVYDGARVNIYHANKGEGLPRHDHYYNHATVCHSGSCVLRLEGKEVIVDKNTQPINLLAGKWHEIEALEDETVFVNIFAENVQ